jgi:glycosyltransferase involved in cell wall biosynthesis
VLVVDDGSKDDTVPIAEALGAIVVRHETNKGYGGALQTIFATARDLGAEELVIIDVQHDPAAIPRLLTELRAGNDVVLPSADPESGFGAYGKKAIEAVLAGGAFDAGVLVADPGLKVAGYAPGARPRSPAIAGSGSPWSSRRTTKRT